MQRGNLILRLISDDEGEDWDRVIDVNLKGAANACMAVIPHGAKKSRVSCLCRQCGDSREHPAKRRIRRRKPGSSGTAKELGPSGIRVNCIAPV